MIEREAPCEIAMLVPSICLVHIFGHEFELGIVGDGVIFVGRHNLHHQLVMRDGSHYESHYESLNISESRVFVWQTRVRA